MAYEIRGLVITLESGADLTDKQFHAVKLGADGKIVACDAVTDNVIGIVQNNPRVGEAAEVMVSGVSRVRVGEDLVAGDRVTIDATGAAATEVAGSYTIGQALKSASVGSIGTVLINTAVPNLKETII